MPLIHSRFVSPLPEPLGYARSVQLNTTFLTLGGRNYDGGYTFFSDIYEYDAENEDWLLREERMEMGRSEFAAVALSSQQFSGC